MAGFKKNCWKIRVWSNCDKNNGYFTWRSTYINDISLTYTENVKYFRKKL